MKWRGNQSEEFFGESGAGMNRWLLELWILLSVTTLVPFATFAYDGHDQTNVAYDNGYELATGYDAVLAHITDEKQKGTTYRCALFATFTEFLAAKATPNLKHLDEVLEEAARLETQWPQQLQALEKSGQPLAALTSNVKGALQKLSKSSGLHRGELSRRFHQIKPRGGTPGATQNNWIDDVTGDVLDGNRNCIGNVFDDF